MGVQAVFIASNAVLQYQGQKVIRSINIV